MRESALLHMLQLAAPTWGARLFRNNVGTLQDARGNFVKYGLAVGSSDLIGWTETLITQDMMGRTVAIFTAVECKLPGKRPTPQQQQFINAVQQAGGIAAIAYSTEDLKHAIQAHWEFRSVHHRRADRRALPVDSESCSDSLDK